MEPSAWLLWSIPQQMLSFLQESLLGAPLNSNIGHVLGMSAVPLVSHDHFTTLLPKSHQPQKHGPQWQNHNAMPFALLWSFALPLPLLCHINAMTLTEAGIQSSLLQQPVGSFHCHKCYPPFSWLISLFPLPKSFQNVPSVSLLCSALIFVLVFCYFHSCLTQESWPLCLAGRKITLNPLDACVTEALQHIVWLSWQKGEPQTFPHSVSLFCHPLPTEFKCTAVTMPMDAIDHQEAQTIDSDECMSLDTILWMVLPKISSLYEHRLGSQFYGWCKHFSFFLFRTH